MAGEAHADEVVVVGDAEAGPWVALYRSGDLLSGALTLDLPGRIMKYRRMVGARTSWGDALEFAARLSG